MQPSELKKKESLTMLKSKEDYESMKSYRIFIGTWNVNGHSSKDSLKLWLSVDDTPPDFYIIGLQEADLSPEAFVLNDTLNIQEWITKIRNGLNTAASYKMVKLVKLVGIMMIIFIKEELYYLVSNVAAETIGTGIANKLGNKGAVAIRFDFHRTSMCFVNCHLAAHMEELERRNQDYDNICARLSFEKLKPLNYIFDHDQIYWFGDMNYRVANIDNQHVKALVEKKCFSALLEHDQLIQQRKLKKVFVGFNEGPICFPPTFKYNIGTQDWDSSEKNRVPAWCDRILWKGDNIKLIEYRSHPYYTGSDHKPVSAVFESSVSVLDPTKHRKECEAVEKEIGVIENRFLPKVTLDKSELHFGTVKIYESNVQTITISNTGYVPVRFEFQKRKINQDETHQYCKPWLHINPIKETLKRGEKCDIHFEVLIDEKTASKFNAGEDNLEDILILHLEDGRDFFINVSGTHVS